MQAGVDGGFEFRLLGAFEIAVDGRPVDIGGAKQELLLAMLALDPVGPVGTDALAEELWGSSPPANLAGGVQNVVSRARRVLTAGGAGSVAITARGPGYVLELDGAGRDVDRYEALARQGHELAGTGDAAAAVDAFRAALRIWRGPVLAGLADRPFARAEAARLEGSRSAVTEALADTLLADGSAGEAVAVLEPLVAREAFRESAAERLMLALYRVGRQSDALQVYRVTRGGLREELGLEPGPALRRLEGQILTQSPELDGPALAVAAAPTAAGSAPDGSSAAHGIRAFLFTDIEASTRRWEGDQDAMAADLATHDGVLRAAVEAHSGRVLSHTGDGLCADFPTSTAALQAAVDGQRALSGQRWRALAALRVRMAVHAGAAQDRDGNYFGPTLNRAARLMSLAAGGQVLCSQTAADLASDRLPAEVALLDLGEHRLADLSRPERVFQVTHPELAGEFPALTSGAEHANNLPAGASRFLGRAAELAELEALLRAERLVTLWGPGGAGKTRLSLELGVRALPEFGDGVWFVELAPLDRGELVAPAVMSALGMLAGSTADPVAELCRYLTNRQALVILDNCEHVVAAVAELVHALLTHCAGVRMVASSRELLGTTGEHAWPIPSLSVPSDEADLAALAVSDAVTLFCDRARASHPGFALTQTNAAAVAEICRRLDGIPLALELASARVRVLGVKGLVARLDDRLDVLTGGSRTADARHQTLRAAVDWSYELMPTAERALLGRLSVFPGTFDLAAAEAVGRADEAQAGFEVLDLLARLVDKSLVVAVDDSDGDVRYRLLETIRQYAQSKLGAAGLVEETQRRHLDHFLTRPVMDWRQKWTWDFSWPDVHRDADNYRVALERAFAVEDTEAVLRLTGGLWNYWVWADHPGARDWLTRALSLPDRPAHPGSVETLLAAGLYFGDVDLNRQAVQLAESLDDRPLLAQVYFFAGTLNDLLGVSGGPDYLVEAVRISEATGNTFIAGWCHYSFAWRAMFAGEPQRGREHAELAVAAAPAQGPGPFYGAHALGCLALASALCGDAERAESLADELLAAAREIPFASIQAMCLVRAAAAATLSGRWAKAESLLRELLVFLRRLGTDRWVGDALEFAAIVLEATDRPLAAGQVLRALDRHRADVTESTGRIQAVAEALNECRARIAARFGSDYHSENADRVSLATVEDRILVALRALDAPVG